MRTRAKIVTWGGIALFVATLVILGRRGFPQNPWTPESGEEYLRGLLLACNFLSGALAVVDLSYLLSEEGPTGEAMAGFMKFAVGIMFVPLSVGFFVAILLRYAYLLLTNL